MIRTRSFTSPVLWWRSSRGETLVATALMFMLGMASGAVLTTSPRAPAAPAKAELASAGVAITRLSAVQLTYPAEVIRVIDGDTFEARVRVWPGIEVNTKVRLRGIDAPELRGHCDDERTRAQAARSALETILAEGEVAVSRVGIDKYGGRVDAAVATRSTADVSAALLAGGFARSYNGGRRAGWC